MPKAKKRAPTDATMRNTRAANTRLTALEGGLKRLQARVRALEQAPAEVVEVDTPRQRWTP